MQLYRCPHQDLVDFGTDVLALDIMRGRDHGLAGYIKYASICQKNKSIQQWSDLRNIIKQHDLELLESIYGSVHSIDLIIGLISEIPADGATVGPTLVCILGKLLLI